MVSVAHNDSFIGVESLCSISLCLSLSLFMQPFFAKNETEENNLKANSLLLQNLMINLEGK